MFLQALKLSFSSLIYNFFYKQCRFLFFGLRFTSFFDDSRGFGFKSSKFLPQVKIYKFVLTSPSSLLNRYLNVLDNDGTVMRAALFAGVLVVVDLGEGGAGDHVAGSTLELTTKLK